MIVGGGLSGLAAAWQLHRHGVPCVVLEARERLGGRVLTVPIDGGCFDLGPSWVWPGQPQVADLLRQFGIATYEQVCEGDLLHQVADGTLHRDSALKPMQHALRIEGGVGALVDALARDLPADTIRRGAVVTGVDASADTVVVTVGTRRDAVAHLAAHVALALPLRLAARLAFEPSIGEDALRALDSTATWMAAHAKIVATYDAPFWRDSGLSGDAFSRRGPLAEIHDASPAIGGPFALMGFAGVDAPSRAAVGRAALMQAAVAQLGELFGAQAAEPRHCELVDWSGEVFTATPADQIAPSGHPEYGVRPPLPANWHGRLHFIGSETSLAHGGLIEGALDQGIAYANHIAGLRPARLV